MLFTIYFSSRYQRSLYVYFLSETSKFCKIAINQARARGGACDVIHDFITNVMAYDESLLFNNMLGESAPKPYLVNYYAAVLSNKLIQTQFCNIC